LPSSKLSVRTRRVTIFVALLVLLGVATTVPLPQSITCPCLVEPAAVWYLMRDGAGQVVTGWERNLLGPGGTRTLVQFERPDIVDVRLSQCLSEGVTAAAGDAVATLDSGEEQGELMALEAERDRAVARRDALLAGERLEDRDVAGQEVRLAESALNEYKPKYDRIKELYETGNASLSQWQAAQGQFQLLSAKVELAQAKLRASEAGARPEDVMVAQSEVNRVERLIENTRSSLGRLKTIVAPLAGTVHLGDEGGILLRIDRTDTMAAVIPLPEAAAAKLDQAQPIEIKLFVQPTIRRKAAVERIDYRDNRGFSAGLVVLLDNGDGRLKTGMNGVARIPMGQMTIWEAVSVKLKGARY
jgi:hypothetical protein